MARGSSRTLRHYDHVGLLPPARTGPGGLRFYERPQLRRLQHIMLLRELGPGLDDIARVLEGADETATLHRHHRRLLPEAARLTRLAATVARTIDEREDGAVVPAEELFTGFAHDPYAEEARDRYGAEAVESQRRAASWDGDTARSTRSEGDGIQRDLAALMTAGSAVDAPDVQAVVARHHTWVCHFWTPGRDAYTGLDRLYVDDERFTATIDAASPGLAGFLRDAIAVYAGSRLTWLPTPHPPAPVVPARRCRRARVVADAREASRAWAPTRAREHEFQGGRRRVGANLRACARVVERTEARPCVRAGIPGCRARAGTAPGRRPRAHAHGLCAGKAATRASCARTHGGGVSRSVAGARSAPPGRPGRGCTRCAPRWARRRRRPTRPPAPGSGRTPRAGR